MGYILGLYWGYIGILEKKTETTVVYIVHGSCAGDVGKNQKMLVVAVTIPAILILIILVVVIVWVKLLKFPCLGLLSLKMDCSLVQLILFMFVPQLMTCLIRNSLMSHRFAV